MVHKKGWNASLSHVETLPLDEDPQLQKELRSQKDSERARRAECLERYYREHGNLEPDILTAIAEGERLLREEAPVGTPPEAKPPLPVPCSRCQKRPASPRKEDGLCPPCRSYDKLPKVVCVACGILRPLYKARAWLDVKGGKMCTKCERAR